MLKLIATVSILALTSCIGSASKQEVEIKTPSSWTVSENNILLTNEDAAIEQNWWQNFEDPILENLIQQAIINNKTIGIAKAKVEEARALRTSAISDLFPTIGGHGAVSKSNQGFFTGGSIIRIDEIYADASWEIDLFGKNQARARARDALLESEEASKKAVTVAMLAEVARTYFDVKNYAEQIKILEKALENQNKTLDLVNAMYKGGMASGVDVSRAESASAAIAAELPNAKSAYTANLNKLGVLVGKTPDEAATIANFNFELKPLKPTILIAAPAKIIANRPDVEAAERQFAATSSNVTAATLNFLPDINLLSFYGIQKTTDMLTHPWNVAANLVVPAINFGNLSAAVQGAKAKEDQAFLNYQQTFLEALADINNALTNYLNETGRNASLTKAFAAGSKATELSRKQYKNGYAGLSDVLLTEQNELQAKSALAGSNAALRKNLVNIYAALGGGWDVEPKEE